MKKILKVLALALVALIAASPMTIDAQTRKSGAKKTATTRKTTSTAKKSTTPAKTSGTAAAKSEVEPSKPARESYIKLLPEAELNIGDFGSGASYQGYVDAGLENGFMLYTTLSFSTDNSNLYLNVAGNSCENGKWSLNANHLTATSDGGNFDLSSPDKGHILDGIFTNAKGTKSNMIAYAVAENECYPNKLAALIKKNCG